MKGHPSQRKGMSIVPLQGEKACTICHKVFFYKRPNVFSIPKTCSKECRYKSASLTGTKHVYKICVKCKKKFGLPPSLMYDKRRGNERIFCSLACSRSMMIKYSEKTKNCARALIYAKLRQGILIKLPCEVCGVPNVEAHHYKGYEKEHWVDVKWLCDLHHHQEHARLRRTGESLFL